MVLLSRREQTLVNIAGKAPLGRDRELRELLPETLSCLRPPQSPNAQVLAGVGSFHFSECFPYSSGCSRWGVGACLARTGAAGGGEAAGEFCAAFSTLPGLKASFVNSE